MTTRADDDKLIVSVLQEMRDDIRLQNELLREYRDDHLLLKGRVESLEAMEQGRVKRVDGRWAVILLAVGAWLQAVFSQIPWLSNLFPHNTSGH